MQKMRKVHLDPPLSCFDILYSISPSEKSKNKPCVHHRLPQCPEKGGYVITSLQRSHLKSQKRHISRVFPTEVLP